MEEIRLISRKPRASCFEAGEDRHALQEELDAYKAGEEKTLEKLKEEAEVETKRQYQKGYEKAMEGWHYFFFFFFFFKSNNPACGLDHGRDSGAS